MKQSCVTRFSIFYWLAAILCVGVLFFFAYTHLYWQTSNTITYAIYMLAEHPDVLQRLRQEILGKVGESRRPTYEDMRDMKYLRAVINGK
jgi:hypothetical protein